MKALQNFYYGETHYFIGDEFPDCDAAKNLKDAGFIGDAEEKPAKKAEAKQAAKADADQKSEADSQAK